MADHLLEVDELKCLLSLVIILLVGFCDGEGLVYGGLLLLDEFEGLD